MGEYIKASRIMDDIRREEQALNCYNCTGCSMCIITPFDVPPTDNYIRKREMEGIDGFVQGTFTCSKSEYPVERPETLMTTCTCHVGDRKRKNICENCEFAKGVLVHYNVSELKTKLTAAQRSNYNKIKITREVYLCTNRNAPEQFHNKYLSRYLSCDEFVKRVIKHEENGQQQQDLY